MKRIHLYGHMDKNFVKKGDKVIAYTTVLGTVGTGNGQYPAHLHHSVSHGLEPKELKAYKVGDKSFVEAHYFDPRTIGVDYERMFGKKMDVGNFGYDWLQWVGYGFHPGLDINGLGGGNTDLGVAFKAECDGVVVWEERTWFKNGGWGNLIMVEEDVPDEPVCTHCAVHCPK